MFDSNDSNDTTTDRGARRLRRPSAATVIASVALFASLGGVGYAAATIGSAEIKNNSVQGKDIRQGTITAADIKKSTRDQLKGQKGAQGPAGATGATGATGAPGTPGTAGAKGDQGAPGLSGLQRVVSPLPLANSSSPQSVTVNCPAGKRVVGTGFNLLGGTSGVAPNAVSDVMVDGVAVAADLGSATFTAYEQNGGTALDWGIQGTILCATVA